MKSKLILMLVLLGAFSFQSSAQEGSGEKFGKTMNFGIGIGGYSGYYGYIGRSLPVLHLNYEFGVAPNFTLAPFVTFYSYRNRYYWGDNNYPFRYYTYRETVMPIGVKGSLYLDRLLHAGSHWDFYLAGSLGFAVVSSSWDNGYYGDRNYYRSGNSLFFDIHAGTEYHFNSGIGAFLDLSNGVSTIGLAFH